MKELYAPKSFITFNHHLFKEGQQMELNGYKKIVKRIRPVSGGKLNIEVRKLK